MNILLIKRTFRSTFLPVLLAGGILICQGCNLKSIRSEHAKIPEEKPNPLIPLVISFQNCMSNRVAGYPAQPRVEKAPECVLYTNLDRLECGIPLRIGMCEETPFLVADSSTSSRRPHTHVNGDGGMLALAELTGGDLAVFLSTARPNRTTIIAVNQRLDCTLLFDSFQFIEPLKGSDTTIAYLGDLTRVGENTFRLTEYENATLSEVSDHPRTFLGHILTNSMEIRYSGN